MSAEVVPIHGTVAPVASPIASAYAALAAMSPVEFERQLELLSLAQQRAAAVKRSLMRDGTHYGIIPGTDKPTLLKPGAEVLLQAFGLVADFKWDVIDGDGLASPALRVIMRALIHVHSVDGPVVAVGVAEANTHEKKHRRRRAQKSCPECGRSTIGKSKAEYGGGYYCNAKSGGCGAKFRPGSDAANALDGQEAGEIDNPDPHDLGNTIVKMAKKRALIDATLTATASSDLFTQDLDEMDPADHSGPSAPASRARSTSAPAASSSLPRSKALLNKLAEMDEARRDFAKAICSDKKGRLTPKWLDDNLATLEELEVWVSVGAPLDTAELADAAFGPKPEVVTPEVVDVPKVGALIVEGRRLCTDCNEPVEACACPF